MTAWDAVSAALDLLDLFVHWRFWLCFLVGIGVALWIHGAVPERELAYAWSICAVIVASVLGLVWDLRS
jgi:hypothetical protein